jgi:hypothetical protein
MKRTTIRSQRTAFLQRWAIYMSIVSTLIFATPTAANADGYIIAHDLMTRSLKKRYPAYSPPKIWLHTDDNKAYGELDGYNLDEKIRVPEGWYLVEVANERQPKNRGRIYVQNGHVTVLPMGLVLLRTDPPEAQPADLCRTWDSAFEISLPVGTGPGLTVGSNYSTDRNANGAILMLAGYYRIVWNGHWIAAEIRANEVFMVPTSMAGPMKGPGYRLHVEKKATLDSPGLKMCERRPTRVLSRRYWVSILRRLSQPPFRERVWAPFDVLKPEGELYTRIRAKKVRGKVNRGTGHAPLLLWEVPDAVPETESNKPAVKEKAIDSTVIKRESSPKPDASNDSSLPEEKSEK